MTRITAAVARLGVAALLMLLANTALAQINNGGSFSAGASQYSTSGCTSCHGAPNSDADGNNNGSGANYATAISDQIASQYVAPCSNPTMPEEWDSTTRLQQCA